MPDTENLARRRGGRSVVAAARQAEKPSRLGVIRYGIQPVTAASEEQLNRIHAASMAILHDIGIEFRDETALAQWRAAGARVEGSRVHLDEELVMGLIAKAPARFTIHGRNPAHVAEIGPDTATFSAMQGAPCVRDLDGIRRASTLEDLRNFNRLTQSLPGFHIAGGFTCEPTDIAVPWRHLEIVLTALLDTDLPFFGLATGEQRSRDCVAMARLVHGAFMDDHAVMLAHISGNSPLVWDATMLEGLRVYAEAGQVVLLSPFVLGAANTPADVAATVAQLNAEALACLAYAQLVRAGTRMIYGQYTVSVSMKSGAPMSGMPEVTLMNVLIGQLARRYGLPWRTTASQSSSKQFDAQSGYESATAMMSGATATANLMMHAGGWDEAGLVCCMGKFVADAEQNLLIAKYSKGVSFDLFDEALEAVARIGPGGHYLGDAFTLKHFREAFIAPEMLDYLSNEQWKAKGSQSMDQRCRKKAAEILAEFQPPPIDLALRDALEDFMARRKSEISPAIA